MILLSRSNQRFFVLPKSKPSTPRTIEIVVAATAHLCALLLRKMRLKILMSTGDCFQAAYEGDVNQTGASDDE